MKKLNVKFIFLFATYKNVFLPFAFFVDSVWKFVIVKGRLIIRKCFALKFCTQKIHTYNNLHFANFLK